MDFFPVTSVRAASIRIVSVLGEYTNTTRLHLIKVTGGVEVFHFRRTLDHQVCPTTLLLKGASVSLCWGGQILSNNKHPKYFYLGGSAPTSSN